MDRDDAARRNGLPDDLERLASSGDALVQRAYELTDAWSAAGIGEEAIDPVLRFIERHPALDLGSPGPLVHFVERFRGNGYLKALLASLERKPTAHTAWMLNRAINGTTDTETRHKLVDAMIAAMGHREADANAVRALRDFVAHQRKQAEQRP